MYSFSTFEIFVVLLLAYCTPIQGQIFEVVEVVSADYERYVTHAPSGRFISLIRVEDNTYKIVETITYVMPEIDMDFSEPFTRATFEIKAIYTMFDNIVVLRIDNEPYYQIEFNSEPEVQTLFDLTTRPKLLENLYSYQLSSVLKYVEDNINIQKDVSISGFSDTSGENPSIRFIIHSGEPAATELKPLMLWTARGFSYRGCNTQSIILTLSRPGDRTYEHYLVEFIDELDLIDWKVGFGRHVSMAIPDAPQRALEYFDRLYFCRE